MNACPAFRPPLILLDSAEASTMGIKIMRRRELYECSCKELDTLISLSREAGALAGRLTGAGWGGCMVALVEDSKAAAVIQHLKAEYFTGEHASARWQRILA